MTTPLHKSATARIDECVELIFQHRQTLSDDGIKAVRWLDLAEQLDFLTELNGETVCYPLAYSAFRKARRMGLVVSEVDGQRWVITKTDEDES